MPRAVEFDNAKVLESAMDLFWKKGYHATSMQDLTEATGLNRSSLYNTFGCKMQLYRTALTQYQKQNGSVFQKALIKALFSNISSAVGIAPVDIEITIKEQEKYQWGFRGITGDEAADLQYKVDV